MQMALDKDSIFLQSRGQVCLLSGTVKAMSSSVVFNPLEKISQAQGPTPITQPTAQAGSSGPLHVVLWELGIGNWGRGLNDDTLATKTAGVVLYLGPRSLMSSVITMKLWQVNFLAYKWEKSHILHSS